MGVDLLPSLVRQCCCCMLLVRCCQQRLLLLTAYTHGTQRCGVRTSTQVLIYPPLLTISDARRVVVSMKRHSTHSAEDISLIID